MQQERTTGADGAPADPRVRPGRRLRTDAAARVPPGQYVADGWPVMHYGRPPTFRPETWDFQVLGATHDGGSTRWSYDDFRRLPRADVVADFHCVTKFTMLDNTWTGVLASTLVAAAPPDAGVTHVLVWADRGYTTNLRLTDLLAPGTVFAHARDGADLSVDHGWPLRLVVPHLYGWKGPKWVRGLEYLTTDRRGFWEERGYHNVGDPWREQRYSYQEDPGDGPPPASTSASASASASAVNVP
ncbi:MAG: molybdopterin-dependent oxidoreductase [Actinomycetales bacterium]|nr:molybdopterin-dependent oxidoreductase [Actinomycetales bacterium]